MEKWMVKNKKADFKAISEAFGVSEVIARLMVNRGLDEIEQMQAYLHPSAAQLHPPELLKDAARAAGILKEKIRAGKKIRIIGDYDVDGVVSTYILMTVLAECGADADYAIPDRVKDGYGINIRMVEAAVNDGVDTILTCDNGIAAVEQTEYAKTQGMTVLITDHHDLHEVLPAADALVNPKQPDCTYPEKGLCGAAVAYKLAALIYQELTGNKAQAEKLLPFTAIATVCDVMELTGENRAIVSLGLDMLRKTSNPGLKALMEVNRIEPERLSAYHLGFILGPCLNATGRLETAVRGVRLLQAETKEEAELLAAELKELNDIRKDMTVKGKEEAARQVENSSLKEDKVLVVFLPECHESLAGIIAGKLRERYNRPSIVLTRAAEGLKGSGRSIEAYPMFEKLTECGEFLEKYGGHPMAAGLSLKEENLAPFRRALNERCGLTDEDMAFKVSIDIVLSLSYLSEAMVEELDILEPFGKGNEKPVFAERNLKIIKITRIGKNAKMLCFLVEDAYRTRMEALYFGDGDVFEQEFLEHYGEQELRQLYQGREGRAVMSVIYYPSVNEYNGNRTLQIVIQRYQFPQV